MTKAMIPAHKDTIMVHCLDTPASWAKTKSIAQIVKEVTRWHVKERGWSGVAYAIIIGPDGSLGKGRDLDGDGDVWDETGAGAKGWNKNVIHLALTGGKGGSADDEFNVHYTPEQDVALRKQIADIQTIAGRKMRVMGHNQVSAKGCPCFDVPSWLARAKAPTATPPAARAVNPLAALIQAILSAFKRNRS